MKRRTLLHAAPALLGLPSLAWAQANYLARAIRYIVPVAAGGGRTQPLRRRARRRQNG